jgi:DNA-binding response OmpR family regulator
VKGARILLLDDNREARWPLARVLRSEGAEVTEADDGVDGLKLLERHEYDLVIADVCMPELGGFGMFSKLRFGDGTGTPVHRDLPVVLITGQISRSELARGMEAGLDDFVAKPVDLDEFRARIRAVLRRSRAAARPHTRTQGDLQDFGISALTQALALSGHSGRLTLRSGRAFGVLDFHSGRLVHAHYTAAGYDQQGEEAALHVLALEDGSFELEPVPVSAPRTVFGDTQGLILRHATHADEAAFGARAAAGARPPPDPGPVAGNEATGPLPPPITQPVHVHPETVDAARGAPPPSDDWVDITVSVPGAEPPEMVEVEPKSGPVVFEVDDAGSSA